jgi:hypothetical protein
VFARFSSFLLLFSIPLAAQVWTLQTTSKGWQFVSPSSVATCKYVAVSKVDDADLQSAGTQASILTKYSSSWPTWASKQSERLKSLGFTSAGQYSYRYHDNMPGGGLPDVPTYGVSGYAMQDGTHAGLGPFNAKDIGYLPYSAAMKCGASLYAGASEIDPYDPNTATAFNSLMLNDFVPFYTPFANDIMVVPDEADFLFYLDQANNPFNAHADGALVVLSNTPVEISSRGGFFYADAEVYSKQALRDFLLNEYAGTVGKSADPASGNYIGASPANTALTALNTAWTTSYTTWNTSDAGGVSGIKTGSIVTGEAFATGDGSHYSFNVSATSHGVMGRSYKVFVNGTQVAVDSGFSPIDTVNSSTFANGDSPTWINNHVYSLNTSILTSNNCIAVSSAGTSAGSTPTWPSCPGTSPAPTVSDGTVTWTVVGPQPVVNHINTAATITFITPPANAAAITVNYTTLPPYKSWGGNAACTANLNPYSCCTGSGTGTCTKGTGLLDEDGFGVVSGGQACGGITGNGPQETENWGKTAEIPAKARKFVAQGIAATYAKELQSAYIAACGTHCPPMILNVYDGPWDGANSVYAAMAPYVDLFMLAPGPYPSVATAASEVGNIIANNNGKPVVVADYQRPTPDSWVNTTCDALAGIDCVAKQEYRGTNFVNLSKAVLSLRNPNGQYAVVGREHWALYDSNSESRAFGLFTPKDNGYDGSAASTAVSSGSCLTSHAYTKPSICKDSNNNFQGLAVASCTSGGSAPTWATLFNSTTSGDGTCVWINEGPYTPSAESANFGNSLKPISDYLNTNICDPATPIPTQAPSAVIF